MNGQLHDITWIFTHSQLHPFTPPPKKKMLTLGLGENVPARLKPSETQTQFSWTGDKKKSGPKKHEEWISIRNTYSNSSCFSTIPFINKHLMDPRLLFLHKPLAILSQSPRSCHPKKPQKKLIEIYIHHSVFCSAVSSENKGPNSSPFLRDSEGAGHVHLSPRPRRIACPACPSSAW